MDCKFYTGNRDKLFEQMEEGSALAVFSGNAPHRSADAYHKFCVSPDFRYLTGINRENQILLMTKRGGKCQATLYIDPVDERYSKWVGRQMSQAQATEISGIDSVKDNTAFTKDLGGILGSFDVNALYLDLFRHSYDNPLSYEQTFAAEISAKYPGLGIKSCDRMIHALRSVKQHQEIELICRAIEITDCGINAMMESSAPGMYEYEYQAHFEYQLKRRNAGIAFDTILASGDSGCILHYIVNDRQVKDGQLLLCDLGASVDGYCADITRTFPINGRFTPRQAQIYAIVLEANKLAIAAAKPGVTTSDLNDTVKDFYAQRLAEIGLISDVSEVGKYYYHGCSHPLGLDVHDVGDRSQPLVPGCVITIEPGLYIAEEELGIRIEDDILITEDGCRVLSAGVIKEIEDIEAFMKK